MNRSIIPHNVIAGLDPAIQKPPQAAASR